LDSAKIITSSNLAVLQSYIDKCAVSDERFNTLSEKTGFAFLLTVLFYQLHKFRCCKCYDSSLTYMRRCFN